MSLGIRGQLTLLVPGLIALGLAAMAFYVTEEQRRDALDELRKEAQQAVLAVGVTAALDVAQNDMASLDTLVAHVTQSSPGGDLHALAVVDAEGRVLAHSDPERFNQVLDDDFTRIAVQAEEAVWRKEGHTLRIGVPARSGLRWATVTASYSLEGQERMIVRARTRWFLGAFVIWFLVGAALYWGMDRVVVRPLRAVQQAVRRMGEGKLSHRAPASGSRELRDLADVVNGMAEKLQNERDNLERTVVERTRELQEANVRLEKLAVTDGLTGLFNHRRFHEALNAELLRGARTRRPLSVLMADVDHFKHVNDTLGHPAGDDLLRKLATVLQSALRQTDLLARYGGEEFSALLPETSKGEAQAVAERMRASVEALLNLDDTWPQRITVSVGVATWPDDGQTYEELLTASDQALYVAKRQGRNKVVAARAA